MVVQTARDISKRWRETSTTLSGAALHSASHATLSERTPHIAIAASVIFCGFARNSPVAPYRNIRTSPSGGDGGFSGDDIARAMSRSALRLRPDIDAAYTAEVYQIVDTVPNPRSPQLSVRTFYLWTQVPFPRIVKNELRKGGSKQGDATLWTAAARQDTRSVGQRIEYAARWALPEIGQILGVVNPRRLRNCFRTDLSGFRLT